MVEIRAEVLVIGSGPGGATTAGLLAAHGKDVVILEEGPNLPLESCEPFSIDEMTQKYRAGGLNPIIGRSKIGFVEGCCTGGGSEINASLYHRTPSEILEHWREKFDLRETTESDLLPHFRYCEDALSVGLCPGALPLASCRLEAGARQLGWLSLEVPRFFKYDGRKGSDGSPIGTRQSMTKSFLAQALKSGARLMPLTRALRLRQSRAGWSVIASQNGRQVEIAADNVFTCGGAMQTPLLLRRSGITKNIGNSLALHPSVKAVAVFDDEVNHEQVGVPVHQVKEFAPRMSFGCSISSPPYLALALMDCPPSQTRITERWRHMAVYYAMITGSNTGRIRPFFNFPDPVIRYDLSQEDLRDLAIGMRRLCELLLAAGARTVYPSMPGAKPIRCADELSTIPACLPAGHSNIMTIHLFSSCPMGENQTQCATNSMGRVHGFSNLFINDASLLCTAPGVNPQGTVMALARRNTLRFLGLH